MKIGILTLHRSINPGAFWQCFSTCQILEKMGHEAVVIDYVDSRRHSRDPLHAAKIPGNWVHPIRTARSVAAQFRHRHDLDLLPIGSAESGVSIENLRLDALIVGSDVVWRRPFDPVFWGRHSPCPRTIAYAASMGNHPWEKTDPPPFLLEPTPFSAISCRDSNTLSFLKKGDSSWSEKAVLVNDPTITLSVPDEYRTPILGGGYCMLYYSRRMTVGDHLAVRRFASSRKLELVSVFYPQHGMRNMTFLRSTDFMRLLLNASIVVTNAFHGAVLARLHGVPVVFSYPRSGNPLKCADQFAALGLEACTTHDFSDLEATATTGESLPDVETIRPALARANIGFLERSLAPMERP